MARRGLIRRCRVKQKLELTGSTLPAQSSSSKPPIVDASVVKLMRTGAAVDHCARISASSLNLATERRLIFFKKIYQQNRMQWGMGALGAGYFSKHQFVESLTLLPALQSLIFDFLPSQEGWSHISSSCSHDTGEKKQFLLPVFSVPRLKKLQRSVPMPQSSPTAIPRRMHRISFDLRS